MRVMVTFEHRFIRTPDGHIYTRGTVDYGFLTRYLAVFDEVIVFSRVEDTDEVPQARKRADGPNVSFFALPYYFGLMGFLKKYPKLRATAKRAVGAADAFILRTGPAGTLLWNCLMKKNIPYGIEVVADPWEGLSAGNVKTKLRLFIRLKTTWDFRRQCRYASVASYVTKSTLQKRYPPKCWSTHYSTIDLPAETILDKSVVGQRMARIEAKIKAGEPLRICFVGAMSQSYKSPDILISSISNCIKKGINLELVLLGDGVCRPKFEEHAKMLGVEDRVHFLGNVPAGQAVYDQLDEADVFVLPSRTEGLPRSVIEAMARGLPCIASNVGGIPELLEKEEMFTLGKVEPLAKKIEEVINDRAKLKQMAERNLEKAHEYCIDVLNERRQKFYQKLADITKAWRLENR